METKHLLMAAAIALGGCMLACGTDLENSSEYTCCHNGAFYECADEDEFNTCGSDQNECSRAPSRDDECE